MENNFNNNNNQILNDINNYFNEKVLSKIKCKTDYSRIDEYSEECEVTYNDKDYYLYHHIGCFSNISTYRLIPKDLDSLEGDFDDVITFILTNNTFSSCRFISKEGDTLKNKIYQFSKNGFGLLHSDTVQRIEKEILLNKKELNTLLKVKDIKTFFGFPCNELFNLHEFIHLNITQVSRNSNDTLGFSLNIKDMDDYLSNYIDLDNSLNIFNVINDNDTNLLELSDKLAEKSKGRSL